MSDRAEMTDGDRHLRMAILLGYNRNAPHTWHIGLFDRLIALEKRAGTRELYKELYKRELYKELYKLTRHE